MARGPRSLTLRHLSTVVGRKAGQGQTDGELLQHFLTCGDETAFELLLWRHERMVRGVCRRVLRCEQDVEDACQATFLTLACKGGSLARWHALGGWLYQVAYRIALRLAADSARRNRHEQAAGELRPEHTSTEPGGEAAHGELRLIVDEEVSRLPEKYRLAVVLCYLEGKTNEQAALELGCPTGTLVTWLARARERLRGRLSRRGVAVTAGALAALLAALDPATAAPPGWIQTTVKAALAFTRDRSGAGLVSTRVVQLTKGALHAMLVKKLKLIAAIALALCLLGSGSAVVASLSLSDEAPVVEPALTPPQEDDKPRDKDKEKPRKNDKKETREKAEEVLTRAFKVGKSPSLIVECFNGPIEVIADAKGEVTARVVKKSEALLKGKAQEELKNIDVQFTQEKDTIKIVARRADEKEHEGMAGVAAEIHVPANAAEDLRTSNGSIHVTGGTGAITVKTTNGSVHAKDAKGNLHLTTTNGSIEVAGAAGRLELETTNGRINVAGERVKLTAHTSNAAISFAGTLGDGDHVLGTANGPINVTLPADAQFKVDAATSNGSIDCEFTGGGKTRGKVRLESSTGDNPALAMKLRTSNGSIGIHKRK